LINGSSLKRRASVSRFQTVAHLNRRWVAFEMLNSELTAEECDATEAG